MIRSSPRSPSHKANPIPPLQTAPIVGDWKYGRLAPHKNLFGISFPPDTILLHSLSVSFYTWEKTGKRSTVEARAEPPDAFVRFCEAAGLDLSVIREMKAIDGGT